MSTNNLPMILNDSKALQTVDTKEIFLLGKARKVLDAGFPDHALLDIWNASVHNLRRRVELFGIDIFISAIKDTAGRKKYDDKGDSIEDRWGGVDEAVLIEGASIIGVLSGKAGKALEMINWIRNHASSAHSSNETVTDSDVFGLAIILQENLFNMQLPEPGHSPSGLFDPIKRSTIDETNISILTEQIKTYNLRDIRTIFGFLLDNICQGNEPAYSNSVQLFPTVWEKSTEDSKKMAGARYHNFLVDVASDDSQDKAGKIRLLEALVIVQGVKYIPDAARALIFRNAAAALAKAKNTAYGWGEEEKAALALAQFGTCVPAIAFEEVYQEILAVWCGNFWGRSSSFYTLQPFIDALNSQQIVTIAFMFLENKRVRNELGQDKPKVHAIALLQLLRLKLTIVAHTNDVDSAIDSVNHL